MNKNIVDRQLGGMSAGSVMSSSYHHHPSAVGMRQSRRVQAESERLRTDSSAEMSQGRRGGHVTRATAATITCVRALLPVDIVASIRT